MPRFRPWLETLERREVPAQILTYWLNTDGNGQWSDGNNWQNGTGPNGMPSPNDLVAFDGAYSNTDCTYDGTNITPGTQLCNAIFMQNGYTATVHLQEPSSWNSSDVGSGGITQSGGDIEQDNGLPINDNGDFTWSGGNININSTALADFNVASGGILSSANVAIIGKWGTTTLAFNDGSGNSWKIVFSAGKDIWYLKS